jgi:hypothetical protein
MYQVDFGKELSESARIRHHFSSPNDSATGENSLSGILQRHRRSTNTAGDRKVEAWWQGW